MQFYQHPIVLLVLSVFISAIVIKQSIIKHKILKNRLIFSFIFVFAMAICFVFYNDIKKNETLYQVMNYIYLGLDVLVALFFFLSVQYSLENDNFYKEIISYIEDSKVYVLVDKKERILQISNCLAKDLGVERSEVYKKRFSTVLDSNLNITMFNSLEVNNAELWNHYRGYGSKAKEGVRENIEIMAENRNGEEFALHLVETPIFQMGKYRGRLWLGERLSEDNIMGMERTIVDNNKQLDAITSRFVSLLDCTKEAIFFVDLEEQSIWCNDQMVSLLHLAGNSISWEEYQSYILEEDLHFYKEKLSALTEDKPMYDISYRYNVGGSVFFVKEKGKICINKNSKEITGTIERIPDYHYARTDIPELDSIKGLDELIIAADAYEKNEKAYLIAVFNFENIPDINTQHGRGFGNMVMAEYVRTIHKNFVNDNQIYRLDGLRFAALVSDLRKMDVLKTKLSQKEIILHVNGSYGTLEFHLDVTMGLAYSKDAGTAKGVYKGAIEALKFAQKPQVNANYAYYQDIR